MRKEIFYANEIYATGHKGSQLRGLSISLFPGEVLGLYGNRHAGKGALFQLMMGNTHSMAGTVYWNCSRDGLRPPMLRITKNSAIIDELKIWENVVLLLGKFVMGSTWGVSRQKNMVRLCLADYGLCFDLEKKASELSKLDKICIEVLAALRHKFRILIIDLNGVEGTVPEFQALKRLLDQLRLENVAVVVSSYQAEVISALSDRVALIYNGRIIKEFQNYEITAQQLEQVTMKLYQVQRPAPNKPGNIKAGVLSVFSLSIGFGKPVSFQLYRGEFAAIVSHRGEIFPILSKRLLKGEQADTCRILLCGRQLDRIENGKGVYFLDARYLDALIDDMTPLENLCLGYSDKAGILGFENKNAVSCIEKDFYEWYGHEGLLQHSNCRSLYKKDRMAINLFRLRFLKVDVIFCNALNVYSDMVCYQLAVSALMELAHRGVSICILSNDFTSTNNEIDRFMIFEDE